MVNDIESGIITSWYRNTFHQYPTEVFPVHPNFVGHRPPQIVMGKKSGVDNVALWSEELGIRLQRDEVQAVLNEVKLRAHALKRVLNKDEFREIVEGVRRQTISLIS
jgi:isopropylmalate/homocitrate/citramalate synthase